MRTDSDPTQSDDALPRGVNDRPSEHDALSFSGHVRALLRFLRRATPPLTVSIEGEWGAGKSSFMRQLERKLRHEGYVTVEFNPWRHRDTEELWAAFVLAFVDQVSDRLDTRERLRARTRLLVARTEKRWQSALAWAIVTLVVSVALGAAIAFAGRVPLVPSVELEGLAELVPSLLGAGVASAIGFGLWVRANVVERLKSEVESSVTTTRYEERVAFIERFHDDFEEVLDAYVGPNRRVFVFIDDLDRCDVAEVADLVESLHLMLSDDSRLVFVLGMDREIVASALAAKHAKLLDQMDPIAKAEYGDRYIQKFVQIPFVLPRIATDGVERFLRSVTEPNREGQPATEGADSETNRGQRPAWERVDQAPERTQNRRPTAEGDDAPTPTAAPGWSLARLTEVTKLVAPVLDHNPRQLKRFVNLYLLTTLLLAEETRDATAVRTTRGGEAGARQLMQQRPTRREEFPALEIGKFVAITLRWPWLIPELRRDPSLLSKVTLIGLRRQYWDAYRRARARLNGGTSSPDGPDDIGRKSTARRAWTTMQTRLNLRLKRRSNGTTAATIDDGEIARRERSDLPSEFQAESQLEPLLELVLAGLYPDASASASVETHAEQRDREFAALLVGHEQEFREKDAAEFFTDLGTRFILDRTGAKSAYNLGVVRRLLQVAPQISAGGERTYKQVQEYHRMIGQNPEAVWLRLELAALLHERDELLEAEEEYRRAIDIAPTDSTNYTSYADFLASIGRPEDADEQYRTAIDIEGEKLEQLSEKLEQLRATAGADEGEVHATADTEVSTKVRKSAAHTVYANFLYDQGRFAAAETNYKMAIELDPDDAVVHYNYANLLYEQGKLDEAESSYKEAIRLDPGNPDAHNNYANLLYEQGKLDEAESSYEDALGLIPDDVLTINNYANLLFTTGAFERAERQYRAALDIDPKNPITHNNYAYLLIGQDRLTEATAYCEAALDQEPNNPAILDTYAELLTKLDRLEDADEQYRTALELEPKNLAAYHRNYAVFLDAHPKYGDAESHRRKARELEAEAEAEVEAEAT